MERFWLTAQAVIAEAVIAVPFLLILRWSWRLLPSRWSLIGREIAFLPMIVAAALCYYRTIGTVPWVATHQHLPDPILPSVALVVVTWRGVWDRQEETPGAGGGRSTGRFRGTRAHRRSRP